MNHIGTIIQEFRLLRELTREELAENICSEKYIYLIEKGERNPSTEEDFLKSFDFTVSEKDIIIDFSNSHIWDGSAVGALDKVASRYHEKDNRVTFKGLDTPSKKILDRLAIYENVIIK